MAPEPSTSRTSPLLLTAGALVALCVAALTFAVTPALVGGRGASTATAATAPPPVAGAVAAPVPGVAPAAPAAAPSAAEHPADARRFAANDRRHVRASWVAGFYPIYAAAQRAYGVNWLLIASVHKQETAFSTHPTTYRGLNSANCCAGPMQFNVTNGPLTTWERYRDAFRRLPRPSRYPNATASHPSVYDDVDAIAAAAALLRDNGAGMRLDASAWRAAYGYYGHDLTGVDYADEVLARAIGWGRDGFCINCAVEPAVFGAVRSAWGAPVRAELAT